MCAACGVSDVQFARAMSVLGSNSWAMLYRSRGWDPVELGVDIPLDIAVIESCDQIEAYIRAHRLRTELSWDDERTRWARRETERRLAWRLGC